MNSPAQRTPSTRDRLAGKFLGTLRARVSRLCGLLMNTRKTGRVRAALWRVPSLHGGAGQRPLRFQAALRHRHSVVCVVGPAAIASIATAQNRSPALKYWSAGELTEGASRSLLSTPTHLIKVVKVSGKLVLESHEGKSDVLFVENGSGSIMAGGKLAGASPLPDMPGELRGNGQPPGVEFHEGTTDIYFVIAGNATLMTEGEIEKRAPIVGRPGEIYGTAIRNGTGYRMRAGDVVNMPPSIPHQSLPDPGGYTYMLIKVNTGTYSWSMIDK